MRLNSQGLLAAGVGTGVVSVESKVIAPGGATRWIDDSAIVYQTQKDGRFYLESYSLITGLKKEIDPKGANEVEAGGGLWAAWSPSGVRDALGRKWPQAGLLTISRKGELVLCPNRQVGIGAEILRPDGTIVKVPDLVTNGVRLEAGVLVWTQKNRIRAFGAADPVTIPGDCFNPVPVRDGSGNLWILYNDHQRLLLQPWSEPKGYVLSDSAQSFNPDIVWAMGRFIVGFSTTQGEGITALRKVSIDPAHARVSLTLPTVPSPPPPPPVAIPNHLDVVKKWRAYYAEKSGPERAWLIVNAVAWDLRSEGAGLLYKPSGTNFNERSIDIVIFKPGGQTFDILGDAEGSATAGWSPTTPTGLGDVTKWRAAIEPPVVTAPPPVIPPPAPPAYDDRALRALIAAQSARIDALMLRVGDLLAEVVALRTKLASARVTGPTSRSFAHGHSVDLRVSYDDSE